ncbi:MAG: hypothetical protein U1F43_28965 [Myxococcota bacterium]
MSSPRVAMPALSAALLVASWAAGPACSDAPLRRFGETCADDAACDSGLCLASLCIDPARCADGLDAASLAAPLAEACVAAIDALAVTTDLAAVAPGASTGVHVRATFRGDASAYDVSAAAELAAEPADQLAFVRDAGGAVSVAVPVAVVGDRFTIDARLAASAALKTASTELAIAHSAGWGPAEQIAAGPGLRPVAVGVDALGCARVLWIEDAGARLVTRRRCGGVWGISETLAAPIGGATVGLAALAVASGGEAVAAWSIVPADVGAALPQAVDLATFAPDDGWSTPSNAATLAVGDLVLNLDVARDGPELALVAWQEMGPSAFPLYARRVTATGFGPRETVDAEGSAIGIPTIGLRATIGSGGGPQHIVWHDGARTYASRFDGAAWGERAVVIDNLSLGIPMVFGDCADDGAGRLVVVDYGGFDNGVGVPEERVEAAAYDPGQTPLAAGWSPARPVEQSAAAAAPSASFTDDGAVVLVWPVVGVTVPGVQLALARATLVLGELSWSRAVVLDVFPQAGRVTPVVALRSRRSTWVVYRRTDDDQVERLVAAHADDAALGDRARILTPSGPLGAFVADRTGRPRPRAGARGRRDGRLAVGCAALSVSRARRRRSIYDRRHISGRLRACARAEPSPRLVSRSRSQVGSARLGPRRRPTRRARRPRR